MQVHVIASNFGTAADDDLTTHSHSHNRQSNDKTPFDQPNEFCAKRTGLFRNILANFGNRQKKTRDSIALERFK